MEGSHSPEWTQEVHKAQTWYCDLNHPTIEEFDNAGELENHLRKVHVGSVDKTRLASTIRRNVVSSPRQPTICPVCNLTPDTITGFLSHESESEVSTASPKPTKLKFQVPEHDASSDEESLPDKDQPGVVPGSKGKGMRSDTDNRDTMIRSKLAKHIAGHLEALAFLSIRYFEGDADDSSSLVSSGHVSLSHGISKEESEQTKSDLSTLSFEDIAATGLTVVVPHDNPTLEYVTTKHCVCVSYS